MSLHHAARAAGRTAAAGAAALTAVLALAASAAAHARVDADTPRPLAENVTLTFVSEAESGSAGFTRIRVVLPEGIPPGEVTLDAAPEGWRLTPGDDGYTVSGPALATGVDAVHRVRVRQLPDAAQLVFKTVETYDDGAVARWIELPGGAAEPEQPAPVLPLTDTASAATAPDPRPAGNAAPAEQRGPSTGLLTGLVVAVPLVLGGGAWWLARRRES
ncbi:DUF1775 domain-containing protein [Streptomyces poriticola]|uniref:DUF1775 domain-containing protein n=1 Tax=Streptomyces poriticola TaxID=3120506 RepID=UPI002FCE2DAD